MTQLIEYQRYQQAAGDLRVREEERQLQFSRAPMPIPDDIEGAPLPEGLELHDLQDAFNRLVKKRYRKQVQPRSVKSDNWSIQQQMTKIMVQIDNNQVVTFEQLFAEDAGKDELVTTFMAMLELVRHQHFYYAKLFVILIFHEVIYLIIKKIERMKKLMQNSLQQIEGLLFVAGMKAFRWPSCQQLHNSKTSSDWITRRIKLSMLRMIVVHFKFSKQMIVIK